MKGLESEIFESESWGRSEFFFIELFSELKICNNFYSAKDLRISCLSTSLNLPKKFPPPSITSILTFLVCTPLHFFLVCILVVLKCYNICPISNVKLSHSEKWISRIFSLLQFLYTIFVVAEKKEEEDCFFCSCCI